MSNVLLCIFVCLFQHRYKQKSKKYLKQKRTLCKSTTTTQLKLKICDQTANFILNIELAEPYFIANALKLFWFKYDKHLGTEFEAQCIVCPKIYFL